MALWAADHVLGGHFCDALQGCLRRGYFQTDEIANTRGLACLNPLQYNLGLIKQQMPEPPCLLQVGTEFAVFIDFGRGLGKLQAYRALFPAFTILVCNE